MQIDAKTGKWLGTKPLTHPAGEAAGVPPFIRYGLTLTPPAPAPQQLTQLQQAQAESQTPWSTLDQATVLSASEVQVSPSGEWAAFLVTGAAGPGSNMHAPNEFLHIDYSSRLTMCVAHVVATLANIKPGEAAGEDVAAPAAEVAHRKSFLESFEESGGSGKWFVGCDCGTAGCVIFDQGMEMFVRPAKRKSAGIALERSIIKTRKNEG